MGHRAFGIVVGLACTASAGCGPNRAMPTTPRPGIDAIDDTGDTLPRYGAAVYLGDDEGGLAVDGRADAVLVTIAPGDDGCGASTGLQLTGASRHFGDADLVFSATPSPGERTVSTDVHRALLKVRFDVDGEVGRLDAASYRLLALHDHGIEIAIEEASVCRAATPRALEALDPYDPSCTTFPEVMLRVAPDEAFSARWRCAVGTDRGWTTDGVAGSLCSASGSEPCAE